MDEVVVYQLVGLFIWRCLVVVDEVGEFILFDLGDWVMIKFFLLCKGVEIWQVVYLGFRCDDGCIVVEVVDSWIGQQVGFFDWCLFILVNWVLFDLVVNFGLYWEIMKFDDDGYCGLVGVCELVDQYVGFLGVLVYSGFYVMFQYD